MTRSASGPLPLTRSFYDCTRPELSEALEQAFRATQIYEAVYKHGIVDFDRITNLPRSLRHSLGETFDITLPAIHRAFEAADGTRRYLIRLGDGEMAETVFIPDGDRNTICVSSQVGCALACRFCLTGQLGFTRHLTAGEIVKQVLIARRESITEPGARDSFNVVLMGMGEPLHNYEGVMRALAILHDAAGLHISMSRITLSTVGLIPQLERLAKETLIPNLAVSLTGATDATRDRLMPINRTYPIRDLVATLERFPVKTRRKITFEYVLLKGMTDGSEDARALARIARRVGAKVNLIPLNEAPDLEFERPAEATTLRFQSILKERGVPAFIRKSRGDDISAACGQLKKKWADSPPEIDFEALKMDLPVRTETVIS